MADAGGMAENAAEIAVANAINNINGRNRVLAGGIGGGAGQNNMMNMRDRLFHAIYFRVAATYAELVPRKIRLAIELLLLAKALVFFFTLVYVHTAFIKNPCTCLQEVQNWPREGVIRVEIIPHLAEKRAIWQSIRQDKQVVQTLKRTYHYDVGPQTLENHKRIKRYESILRRLGVPIRPIRAYSNETLYFYFEAINLLDTYEHPSAIPIKDDDDDDEQYIVEYSLEYGHLRLSSATRKRLKIPVLTVQLDPNTNKCFGDKLMRYLLKRLLGYDDLLMASVRAIAEKEDDKGYLRNVITGEHYRFVSIWWAPWSSYPAAFCVMLLFTFSVSMLLRYSHHQIFVFIVDLLQMLEYNVVARFPIAPLLTVILALVGMEAIMSEFFNDTTTAFYIILIVWIADQFDAICCHTSITKRHWLRFFYLYHFAFYAYHYRFSGQYRTLALLSSYLFIQHSMVFFFHRYELPAIMAQRHVFFITRNQPNAAAAGAAAAAAAGAGAGAGGAAGAAGAGAGAEGGGAGDGAAGQQAAVQRARLIVMRLFRQLAAQRQGQQAGQQQQQQQDAGVAAAAAAAAGGGAGEAAGQLGTNASAAVAIAFGNLRRLPLVGPWFQRQQQFTTVRRVFFGQGHHGPGQMMHVRVQRMNVADIPGLQTRVAAAAAAAAAAVAANAATVAASAAATAATAAATAAAEAAATAAAAATTSAAAATAAAATATTEDVESNHGQERSETAATTTNSINDAGVRTGEGEGAGEQQEMPSKEAGAEAAQDKQEKEEQQKGKPLEQGLDPEQAGVPKTLKNLNSAMADIINMPDTTTTTTTTTEGEGDGDGAENGKYLGQLLPLVKQLANNLPAQSTKELERDGEREQGEQTPLAGEKLSGPVQAQSRLPTDQQKANQAANTATATAAAGAATGGGGAATAGASGSTSKQSSVQPPETQPWSRDVAKGDVDIARAASIASTMMDGRQTVDFIEGDSFTSTANYDAVDAVANHMEGKQQQKVEQQQQQGVGIELGLGQQQGQHELMKTPPHTSNRVTTAAEAATANN